MADDHTLQSYRSYDPDRRAAEPSRPSEADDPLAELARLIGQSESFTEFSRNNLRQEQAAPAAPTLAPDSWQYPREEQFASPDSRQAYGSKDFIHPLAHGEQPRVETHPYDQVPFAPEREQYADHWKPDGGADEHHADNYLPDDVALEPREDAMYDDPPRAHQRGGLAIALALVGCAMLGTAGAYAYRSYYGHSGSTQPPPIITADSSTPTKIAPASAGDPQSSKAIQDRLVDAGNEQVVSKQEEPVPLKELGTQPAPRVVVPVTPAAPGAAAQQWPSAPRSGASNEPKKVRTVTIRPDGTDVSARPVGAPSPAPTASRTTVTPPAPRAGAAPARNGPLSLDPQTGEPVVGPASRTRTAAAPPSSPSAPEGTAGITGGFVVQLSSQKTESEAQSSFRSLQAKFPNELGGRQPIIRRVDLGNKGVFYRTMIGPFASAHEASQFCAGYKAAGGQCVVPNN